MSVAIVAPHSQGKLAEVVADKLSFFRNFYKSYHLAAAIVFLMVAWVARRRWLFLRVTFDQSGWHNLDPVEGSAEVMLNLAPNLAAFDRATRF